jgi:hypothetical protein
MSDEARELPEPLSEEELEALRLTASHPAEVIGADGSVVGEMPNLLERRLLATIDAFLAQPTAAREAVLRIAAEHALEWVSVVKVAKMPGVGDTQGEVHRELEAALADTSPAALLAQGEEEGVLKELVRRAETIIGMELEPAPAHMQPDRKIKGAALEVVDWLRFARAALAPGEPHVRD